MTLTTKVFAQEGYDDMVRMVDSAVTIKYARYKSRLGRSLDKDYFKDLYLIDNLYRPVDYLPSQTKLGIKGIAIYDAKNKSRISDGITTWRITSELKGDTVTVFLTEFYVLFDKSRYSFSNGGGTRVTFHYNHAKKLWELLSIKEDGI